MSDRVAGPEPDRLLAAAYAQLTAIYWAKGHDRYARTVLIASQNRRW